MLSSLWLALAPDPAIASCTGQFAANRVCGTGASPGVPGPISPSSVFSISPPQGRLTLTSGTPVMTASVAAATTLYYTPSVGQSVPIWNGLEFIMTDTGGELSQATTDSTKSPSAVGAGQVYDIFVWSDSGTVRATRGPTWATGGGSATARGTGTGSTELTALNGILVNKYAITNGPAANEGTYVGTCASDGSSQFNMVFGGTGSGGVAGIFGCWNAYNRVPMTAVVLDNGGGADWTYSSSTIRESNNSASNRVTFVSGLAVDSVHAIYAQTVSGAAVSGTFCRTGLALDSTTDFNSRYGRRSQAAAAWFEDGQSPIFYPPQIGSHFISSNEQADNTNSCTFFRFTTSVVQGLRVTTWQ